MSGIRYTVEQCAIVVLAAGMSSRLGRPKQLLLYQGESLLKHAVNAALQTSMRPVIVVVGANSDEVKREIAGMELFVMENEGWKEGMASSLRCGLAEVQKINADADGIIFMVCDQPYVSKSLLEGLLQAQHKTGLPIVASGYEGKLGTPALFHQSLFAELMELKGDTGARKLIRAHEELVKIVDFPKGMIDIDTKADYDELLQ